MNKDVMIQLLTNARNGLVRTAQAVPEDKLNWRPLENGRTTLDLLGDAAQRPRFISQLLAEQDTYQLPPDFMAQLRAERQNWTREQCLQKLQDETDTLFEQIRALPDEDLARVVTLPLGGGLTLPLAGWIMMVYRTYISRFAQINYIQTLYGDFEPH